MPDKQKEFDPHDEELVTMLLNATKIQAEANLAATGACRSCFWGSVILNAIAEFEGLVDDEELALLSERIGQAVSELVPADGKGGNHVKLH